MNIVPDCLIFDVDGVLIDGLLSFPEMIRIVFEEEWRGAGLIFDRPAYDLELNAVFKLHGAFNDDYDIAWTLLNIARSRGCSVSEALPTPEELRELIAPCGDDCVTWLRANFEETFSRKDVIPHCEAVYFGDGRPGCWTLETPLVTTRWDAMPLPAYVFTGRNTREWRLAQRTLGWEDMPDERVVNKDSGVVKPSPDGLDIICRRFGYERPLFFGDTESDARSHRAFKRGWFAAIGGLLKEEPLSFASVREAMAELLGYAG